MSPVPIRDPLTPPDCDLRGLPFMPLDVIRLLDSDIFAKSTGDEFKAALALWCKSWTQVPAASLPDDERVLAHLSGAGAKWRKVRETALSGWVKCSDGRLYHSVVAEKALEALPHRQAHAEKKSAEAERKAREREDRKALFGILRANGVVPEYDTSTRQLREMAAKYPGHVTPKVTPPVTPVTRTVTAKTGTGTGTGTDSSEDKSSASGTVEDLDATAWQSAVKVLTGQGAMGEPDARRFFGKLLAQNKLLARDMLPSCAGAMVNATQDPKAYLTRAGAAVAKRRTEGAGAKHVGFV